MESLHWYKSEKFDPNNEDDMYWVETDPEIREYQQLYDLSPKDHILYLVSAEKNAIRYWKVGITEKESAYFLLFHGVELNQYLRISSNL